MLTDRDEMGNLYREPSIHVSYQVSIHLAQGVSEEKIKMGKVNERRTTDDGRRMPSNGKANNMMKYEVILNLKYNLI